MELQVTEQTEAEILRTAQERALRILAKAREEAEHRRAGGAQAAADLLLQQQQKAEQLLQAQRSEAADAAHRVQQRAEQASAESRQSTLAEAEREADALLDAQWLAAEALRASERQAAVETDGAVQRGAVGVLMEAHREAAAVLLQARMVVEERREQHGSGQRS